jgi:hypothetical protein
MLTQAASSIDGFLRQSCQQTVALRRSTLNVCLKVFPRNGLKWRPVGDSNPCYRFRFPMMFTC